MHKSKTSSSRNSDVLLHIFIEQFPNLTDESIPVKFYARNAGTVLTESLP